MNRMDPKWFKIDWTLSHLEIARRMKVTPQRVSQVRKNQLGLPPPSQVTSRTIEESAIYPEVMAVRSSKRPGSKVKSPRRIVRRAGSAPSRGRKPIYAWDQVNWHRSNMAFARQLCRKPPPTIHKMVAAARKKLAPHTVGLFRFEPRPKFDWNIIDRRPSNFDIARLIWKYPTVAQYMTVARARRQWAPHTVGKFRAAGESRKSRVGN